jgi:hypothetical protein
MNARELIKKSVQIAPDKKGLKAPYDIIYGFIHFLMRTTVTSYQPIYAPVWNKYQSEISKDNENFNRNVYLPREFVRICCKCLHYNRYINIDIDDNAVDMVVSLMIGAKHCQISAKKSNRCQEIIMLTTEFERLMKSLRLVYIKNYEPLVWIDQ